jgi:hypothetical protein
VLEIPSDLHPDCAPLAWLLGSWEGAGIGGYPTVDGFRFGQELRFGFVPGKPFVEYASRAWLLDDDGTLVRPLARESGYWRPQAEPAEGLALPPARSGAVSGVEVLLAHPTGFVEVYLGVVQPARVDLVTRGVLKTETAKDYRSGSRVYGLVGGRLMWAYDMAAMGHPLQSHLSAELIRTGSAEESRL